MRIILSRTDSIGDVVLSLPLAGFLKQELGYEIIFIGREYTKPILECSKNIDWVVTKEQVLEKPTLLRDFKAEAILFLFPDIKIAKIAYQIKIPQRIGTAHRLFHWLYLNKKVFFSRKRSNLHESQLNFFLLKGLGMSFIPSLSQIPQWYGLRPPKIFPKIPLDKNKIHFIIHPKSKGSAREWPLENYKKLVELLPKITFYVTGTESEGQFIRKNLPKLMEKANVKDLTGKLSLTEFIGFIYQVDGLVAASTGPLHIAAALGKIALGLFTPLPPIYPQRWAPLGEKAYYLLGKEFCHYCPFPKGCPCIEAIKPNHVAQKIETLVSQLKI